MNKIKKIFGILIVLIIVLIIIITLLNKEEDNDGIGLEEHYIDYTVYPVKTSSVYYTVESCVQKYVNYLSLDLNKEHPIIDEVGNKYYSIIPEEIKNKNDQKKAIYDILSTKYINEKNIKVDNIENFIGITNKPLEFTALEMNYIEMDDIRLYSVYGRLEERITGNFVDYVYFKVMLDVKNMSFSIEPIDDCNNIKNVPLEKDEAYYIEKNGNNTFKYIKVTESNLVNYYINYFKKAVVKYPNEIYKKLDKEYKDAKFSNEKDFENYISERIETINNIFLNRYQKIDNKDYTQYVCVDNYGNYYIFNETAIMNYELILDTYTIDLPEFTEKYETATTEERVMLNIQKIVEALNAKDYKYVYGKLADEFKANYFKTYEDFEKYAKNEFDIGNEITFNRYTESENYSTYGITLKGKNKTITKTIVMRLDVGTNFVMSFNVN